MLNSNLLLMSGSIALENNSPNNQFYDNLINLLDQVEALLRDQKSGVQIYEGLMDLVKDTGIFLVCIVALFLSLFLLALYLLIQAVKRGVENEYLARENIRLVKEQNKLSETLEQIKEREGGLREVSYKINPYKNTIKSGGFWKDSSYMELGYKVQLFIDNLPFETNNPPEVLYKIKTTEVDKEKVDQYLQLAVDKGTEAMKTLAGPGMKLLEAGVNRLAKGSPGEKTIDVKPKKP